jgi:hypothetical protein
LIIEVPEAINVEEQGGETAVETPRPVNFTPTQSQ